MADCQGCGRRVIWMRNTSTGKAAPVDPEPVPSGNVVVHADGYRVLTRKEIDALDQGPTLFDMGEPEMLRYTLHFGTCPQKSHYRRCSKCHHTPCQCSGGGH